MARQGVWSVGTVAITGDEGEEGVAVLVVDEQEGGLIANDLWSAMDEGDAVRTSLSQLFEELGRPRKIVVKAGTLAKAVRLAGIREDLTVGATPQLDAIMQALERDVAELADMPGPLDGEGATSAHLNSFFVAAEAMRLVAPWAVLPPASGFAVEAPGLGMEEAAAFLVSGSDELEDEGEQGFDDEREEDLDGDELAPGGWVFVESPEDFEAMFETVSEMMSGAVAEGARAAASAMTLAYERAEELGPSFQAFVREHGLEVPAEGWVPLLTRTQRGVGLVPPSGTDYELATAICTAIANITVELADSDDEDGEEGICAQVVTQSGLEILVEGPMPDDDDDEEDEEEDPLSS